MVLDIPWTGIVGFRNRAMHSYFAMAWTIVWDAALDDFPVLQLLVADIMARNYQKANIGFSS